MSSSPSPTPKPHLLALPAEILNTIIEYTTYNPSPKPIHLQVASWDLTTLPATYTWRLSPPLPALAHVCKSLTSPTTSIYFNQNAFIWDCSADDRSFHLEQIAILKRHLGPSARHLWHFWFNVEYVTQYPNKVRRARYQIRTMRDREGRVSCERYFLGMPHCGGVVAEVLVKFCACDLVERGKEAQAKEWNLLEFAESFIASVRSRAQFDGECEVCGWSRIKCFEEDEGGNAALTSNT